MGKGRRSIATIALSTSVAIFSLFACTMGAYAWFESSRTHHADAGSFEVTNMDCQIESVTLLKFEYKSYVIGGTTYYDYVSPAKGTVKPYGYDFDLGQFGGTVQGQWQAVDPMNAYDPEAYHSSGDNLMALNCNAVYKIVFSSQFFANASLSVSVLKGSAIAQADQILLSSCADFNLYTETDVNPILTFPIPENPAEDTNDYRLYRTVQGRPVFNQDNELIPAWHPSYKQSGFSAEEEVYYKISYLALHSGHSSFYGYRDPSTTCLPITGNSPISASFSQGRYTLYLNVNYAPSQLTSYSNLDIDERIRAVSNCSFSFSFE